MNTRQNADSVPRWSRVHSNNLHDYFVSLTAQGISPIPHSAVAIETARLAINPLRPLANFASNYSKNVHRYNNKEIRLAANERPDCRRRKYFLYSIFIVFLLLTY